MRQKSWLGDCNIIDRTQDRHKSELQKERELGSRRKINNVTRSVFDYIDDSIGIDLFGIIIVFLFIIIWAIISSYYFQVPLLNPKSP